MNCAKDLDRKYFSNHEFYQEDDYTNNITKCSGDRKTLKHNFCNYLLMADNRKIFRGVIEWVERDAQPDAINSAGNPFGVAWKSYGDVE